MPFVPQGVDVDAAVRTAIANRTDVQIAKNNIAKTDIDIKFFKNQTLPDINANVNYASNSAGGRQLSPSSFFGGTSDERTVIAQRGYSGVLGDLLSSSFPTFTFGVSISYPIGQSTSETSLARARLQHSQAETQLRNLELQIATQVRDAARQVQTNQKRVETSGVARALAERRLEAEEKKFAAGIQISFFVFQAQRDLAQARTNEIRAISDYNKSVVDFEAVQQTALR
jgi:outer membrane protein TolC